MIKLKHNLPESKEPRKRREIFNFNDKEGFKKFIEETEKNDDLLKCLDNAEDIDASANKWLKIFNGILRKSFKKIRIKEKKEDPLKELFLMRDEKQKIKAEKENDGNFDEAEIMKE